MLAPRQRLVALNVDIDIGRDALRNLDYAVGPTAVVGRGHANVPFVLTANAGNLSGIRSHDYIVQLSAGASSGVDMGQHRPAGNVAKDLAREAVEATRAGMMAIVFT